MNKTRSIPLWLAQTLLTAVAYAVAGRLALLLAIPPGYASPVWPAAGIALFMLLRCGYAAWPGIVLGSFLTNVPLATLTGGDWAAIWDSMKLPTMIGLGAAAQAILGTHLIRRFVGFPTPLLHAREVWRFLLLGGPAACIVNGAWGPACLAMAGILPWENYTINAWYWWIGDAIGVLVALPLLMVLAAQPRDVWRARWITVALPLAMTLALVVVTFIFARGWERERVERDFQSRASAATDSFEEHVSRYLEVLDYIAGFFAGSNAVERDEFHAFASPSLRRYPGLAAVSWNRRVLAGERPAFEERVRREGFPDFQIAEHDENGQLIAAATRDDYAPITYIEPADENRVALGFDVASDPIRREALERARESGSPAATRRIRLVQPDDKRTGLLVFHPIYTRGVSIDTPDSRAQNLQGYTVAVFRIEQMISESLRGVDRDGIDLRLYDDSAPEGSRLLYADESGRPLNTDDPKLETPPGKGPLDLQWVSRYTLGGREWKLVITPTLSYIHAQQTWHAWLVCAGGLALTSLLGVFLLTITGRGVIDAHRAEELRRRNVEMEQFIYTVSHDLKSPLFTLSGFTGFARKALESGQAGEVAEALDRISAATSRMNRVTEDLLELSRIGRVRGQTERVDTTELVCELADSLALQLKECGAQLRIEGTLPAIQMERTRLIQVFQNLLVNAIRYGCDSPQPLITVGSSLNEKELCYFVRDNGAGIAPEYHAHVFDVFRRLRKEGEGTGMGLAIVARIMLDRGGRCWVESVPGQGATFWVAFPRSTMRA